MSKQHADFWITPCAESYLQRRSAVDAHAEGTPDGAPTGTPHATWRPISGSWRKPPPDGKERIGAGLDLLH